MPPYTSRPPGTKFGEIDRVVPAYQVNDASLQKVRMLLIAAHVEYRDEFPGTEPHFEDWCARLLPTDVKVNAWAEITLKDIRQ